MKATFDARWLLRSATVALRKTVARAQENDGDYWLNRTFWLFIVAGTVIAANGNIILGGFNIHGWVWVITILLVPMWILRRQRRPTFPWILWVPFLAYVALRTNHWDRAEIQTLGILLCPVLVATVASVMPFDSRLLRTSYKWLFILSVLSYVCASVYCGSPAARVFWYALGPVCMTWIIIAVAAMADFGAKSWHPWIVVIVCWLMMVLSESRMPVIAMPALLIVAPSALRAKTRLFFLLGFILLALIAFEQPYVQRSLFKSEAGGDIKDLMSLDPATVEASGRLITWPLFLDEIDSIWLGEGSMASNRFGMLAFQWGHPHNEYIRVLFDYGIIGAVLLLVPMLSSVYACYTRALRTRGDDRWCNRICVGGLLAMFLLAITGNVLMYSVCFGNVLFATIGASYAVERSHTLQPDTHQKLGA